MMHFRCARFGTSLALAAAVAIGVRGLAQESGEPATTRTNAVATLFGVARANDTDIVLLRNGDRLTGDFLSEKLSLRTSYGELSFDLSMLSGLDLERTFQTVDAVVASNGNRFSGFINEDRLPFRTQSGGEIELRRETLLKAVFRPRPSAAAQGAPGSLVRLKNGDMLTGTLINVPLVLNTGYARVSVALDKAARISQVDEAGLLTRIVLRNGDVLQGLLEAEEYHVRLDLGFDVRLFRERVQGIEIGPDDGSGDRTAGLDTPSAVAGTLNPGDAFFPELVKINPGQFIMGSPLKEIDRDWDEGPQTESVIEAPFWIGKFEVTQDEFESLMGSNPSHFVGEGKRPVEKVSWQEAVEYCARLNQRAAQQGKGMEGHAYRLPTEVEWEYACRAGSITRFSYGDDPGYIRIGEYAWFSGNGESSTHIVGSKKPNAWGLHDMHGNVWEWCLDRWSGSVQTTAPASESSDQGALRVARGGSWLYSGKFCRAANRDDYGPSNRCSDVGFRIVLAPIER